MCLPIEQKETTMNTHETTTTKAVKTKPFQEGAGHQGQRKERQESQDEGFYEKRTLWQQDGDCSRTAAPQGRSDTCRDCQGNRLAEPQRPGFLQWACHEEDGTQSGVDEKQGERADVPDCYVSQDLPK